MDRSFDFDYFNTIPVFEKIGGLRMTEFPNRPRLAEMCPRMAPPIDMRLFSQVLLGSKSPKVLYLNFSSDFIERKFYL